MPGILTLLVALSLVLGAPTRSAAETIPAIVTGAERLYVRRGPGVDFPAFATIEQGERVEVERLEGVWALVKLASEQTGYVHSTFLSFPGQMRATVIAVASPTPTSTPMPQPTASWTPKVLPSPSGEPAPPGGGEAGAHDRTSVASGSTDGEPDLRALQQQIERLTLAIDALEAQLGARSTRDGTEDEGPSWTSASVALLFLMALLVGWVAGGAYGRQVERTRRSRIRF
jgi:uncharacterized protein YraI